MFLGGTEFDCQCSCDGKHENEQGKAKEGLPIGLLAIEGNDHFPEHENYRGIEEAMEAEALGLEIIHEALEELDDDEEGKYVGYHEGKADGEALVSEKYPAGGQGFGEADCQDEDDIKDEDIDRPTQKAFEQIGHVRELEIHPALLVRKSSVKPRSH
jgi:hypothetical protein